MSKRILTTSLVAVVAMGFLGNSAMAEIIVHHPVNSNQSDYYPSFAGGMDAKSLWDEYGNDTAKNVERPDLTDPTSWYISSFNGSGWMTHDDLTTPVGHWVVLDLGTEYDLDYIDVWNYNHHSVPALNARGINEVRIWKADDIDGTVSASTPLYDGNFTISPTNATPMYYNDHIALTGATGVRFVKIVVDSTHGAENCVGLGFVTFEENVVPEPSTLALLAASLIGLLAYAWRKRK